MVRNSFIIKSRICLCQSRVPFRSYNLGVHWIKTVSLLWLVTEQLTENSSSIPSNHFSWSASPPMLWKVCWFLLFLFQKAQTRPLQVSCPSLDLFLSPRAPSTVQWRQLCLQWCYNKKDNNNLISELSCWFISSVQVDLRMINWEICVRCVPSQEEFFTKSKVC